MTIQLHTGLSGRVRLVKHRDGDVSQELEFNNLILDGGLDRWGSGGIIDRCSVGAGNTAPTAADVGLGSLIATSTTKLTVPSFLTANSAERWTEVTTCYRFDAGVGTGTIAEIGMGWDTGLWSRALVKDGSGVPTTITKLADETLDVYYTLRIKFPSSDITGSIVLEGVTYDYILRPAEIASVPLTQDALFAARFASSPSSSGDMRAGSSEIGSVLAPAPNSSWSGATTAAAYSPGTYKRRLTFSAGLTDMNVSGGFKALGLNIRGGSTQQVWQMGFYIGGTAAAVPKTAAKIFSLTVDFTWARGS